MSVGVLYNDYLTYSVALHVSKTDLNPLIAMSSTILGSETGTVA